MHLRHNRDRAQRPAEHVITPRPIRFAFGEAIPKYWAKNDPLLTSVMTALSMTFPEGERFFMDAVRAFRDQIDDPALADDVRAFLAQEALHSREHDALNGFAASRGADQAGIYGEVAERLAFARQHLPPIAQLGMTCALEHFTAILAQSFLTSPHVHVHLDPTLRRLWIWHAVEELEHKAVAFDVFKAVGGSEFVRIRTMLTTSVYFLANTTRFILRLMKNDGQLLNVRSWFRGMWTLWGPNGLFTRAVPAYFRYFRRDFHPWNHDDRGLVAEWSAALASSEKYGPPDLARPSAPKPDLGFAGA